MATQHLNYGLPVKAEGLFGGCTPQDLTVFFDDFIGCKLSTSDNLGQWLYTSGGGTAVGLDGTANTPAELGGILKITAGATASEAENLQVPGQAFQLYAGYPLYFETRISANDVSDLKIFVGLAAADTALIPSLLASTYTAGAGFYVNAGAITAISTNASGTHGGGTTIKTGADATWYKLAFLWDGVDQLTYYIDGTEYAVKDSDTTANYVPTALTVTPSIEVEDTASAAYAYVDYVLVIQKRYTS